MAKQLLFSDAARRKMMEGVDILAHAVGTTLGPTGRNVILSKSFGGPTVTKDGVTVSKEIELRRPVREHGRQAGQRGRVQDLRRGRRRHDDRDHPGPRDLSRGAARTSPSGANPTAVRRGIEKAVEAAVAELTGKISRPVSKKEEIAQVGAISANNDPDDRQHAGRCRRAGRPRRRDHRRGRQDRRRPSSSSSRACSSTRAT